MERNRGNGGGQGVETGRGVERSEQLVQGTRQRRKLVAYYLTGDDDVLREYDVAVTEGQEEEAKRRISRGEVTAEMDRDFLSAIARPVDMEGGVERAFSRIGENPSEMQILGYMTRDRRGAGEKISERDVEEFVDKFETPMDFEREEQALLEVVKTAVGEGSKYDEYATAMEGLKRHVFGKREVYFKEMKQLRSEVEEERELREFERRVNEADRQKREERSRGREVEQRVVQRRESEVRRPEQEILRKRSEKQGFGRRIFGTLGFTGETREKAVFGDVGWMSVNKGELTGDRGRLNEDASYVDEETGVIGVFDGAGGHFGGAAASQTAARKTHELIGQYGAPTNEASMKSLLNRLNQEVARNREAGLTTGVIGRVIDDREGKRLVFGSVGDSRIYLIRGKKLTQLTEDEGYRNVIRNALGDEEEYSAKQTGTVFLKKGDALLFCSDGVTGDTEEQALPDELIVKTVQEAKSAREAAQRLTRVAKKRDDRTAVVVRV